MTVKPLRIESDKNLVDVAQETRITLQLRVLKSKHKNLHKHPTWVKYYGKVTYVLCTLFTLFSLSYLAFIGETQAHTRFQIQYAPFVDFLEYNSYSVLCPLVSPICMVSIVYRVKTRTKLEEGDFYGFLGIMLFLALINLHDLWGLQKFLGRDKDKNQIKDREKIWGIVHFFVVKDEADLPPPKDEASRDILHWQYAWTTKRLCANKYVRNLEYEFQFSRTHVKRQIIFVKTPLSNRFKRDVRSLAPHDKCNLHHDIKDDAKTREWMDDVQNEFKCCGPYGYEERKTWFKTPGATKCKKEWIKNGDIPGCHKPLIRWLEGKYKITAIFQGLQALFYILSMIITSIHRSAMKQEEDELEKTYSLLNLNVEYVEDYRYDDETEWFRMPRPSYDPVIVGQYPPPLELGAVMESTMDLVVSAFTDKTKVTLGGLRSKLAPASKPKGKKDSIVNEENKSKTKKKSRWGLALPQKKGSQVVVSLESGHESHSSELKV